MYVCLYAYVNDIVTKSDVAQGSILLRGRPFESDPSNSNTNNSTTDTERLTHNNSSLINISHNKTNVVSTIAVAISPDGHTVASSNGDHFVKVFDFHSGIQVTCIDMSICIHMGT